MTTMIKHFTAEAIELFSENPRQCLIDSIACLAMFGSIFVLYIIAHCI